LRSDQQTSNTLEDESAFWHSNEKIMKVYRVIRGSWGLNDPLVPINIPAAIISIVESKGHVLSDILANTQIDQAILDNPKSRLSYTQLIILCQNVLSITQEPWLGLEIGRRLNVNQLGMLGYALMSSATIRHALVLAQKYHPIIDPAFAFIINSDEKETFISINPQLPLKGLQRFVCDNFIASFINFGTFLTGQKLSPQRIHFNFPAPENSHTQKYAQEFSCEVVFDQPRTEFVIKNDVLDIPLVLADEAAARMAEDQCANILERVGIKDGVVHRVRKVLLSQPGHYPDIEAVARQMATSTRTLSRTLQDIGTSFQKILDEVRQEIAIEYLTQSSLPVEEIALLLGYNDASNFRKAFKKWTKNTPRYYRGGVKDDEKNSANDDKKIKA
jgi:AraC-like DNA-binding protein